MLYQGKNEYRNGYEALKAMCEAKSAKEIAHYLIFERGIWRGKSLESGAARIRGCLSPEKAEYFSFSEIIAICEYTNRFDPFHYACDRFGMRRPTPINVNEQIAHLTGVIERASESLEYVMKMSQTITHRENQGQTGQETMPEEGASNVVKFCINSDMEHF